MQEHSSAQNTYILHSACFVRNMIESARLWQVCLVHLLLHLSLSTSQPICLNTETYTNNSTYQSNLNSIISTLSRNVSSSGFLNVSSGQNPDQVNAVVLCRGDISLDACSVCLDATAPELVRRCPNNREAIFWNETCMVRYSNQPLLGRLQLTPVSPNPSTTRVSNPPEHDRELMALLESLRDSASNAGDFKKIAAGNRSTRSDAQTIYALEQCTPDLSVQDCVECLNRAIEDVPNCCGGIIGAGILRPSCTLRFENYRFFNESMVQVPQQPLREEGENKNRTGIIVGVCLGALVLAAIAGFLFIRWRMSRKTKKKPETSDEVESLQYEFSRIRAATNDFSDDNKLGQGGFGAVYWGKLEDGQEIAVKRLSKDSGQGNHEFKNEVMILAGVQHRNLVRLLGFSIEGSERLLVYEFLQNSSLDHFLFDPMRRAYLDWSRRYKIIGGIARGLLYLHEDSRIRIIHRDLKTSNVLLDGDMNPKIADFGMARLFEQDDQTQGNTSRIVGTYGYMSPEYAMHGQFSVKSDVFSFGVLVLEIVSGQRNSYVGEGESAHDLLSFTWKKWREGEAEDAIDPVLRAGSDSIRDMVRCIHIGLLCVQENAANRPTMASVVLMLNSFSMTLQIPWVPAFFTGSMILNSETSTSRTNASQDSSRNDVSISEFYPR